MYKIKVDENMQCAQQRDALRNQKFHFRKYLSTSTYYNAFLFTQTRFLFHLAQTPNTPSLSSVQPKENESEHRLMSIDEIINGSVRILFSHMIDYYLCLETICWSFEYRSKLSIEYRS